MEKKLNKIIKDIEEIKNDIISINLDMEATVEILRDLCQLCQCPNCKIDRLPKKEGGHNWDIEKIRKSAKKVYEDELEEKAKEIKSVIPACYRCINHQINNRGNDIIAMKVLPYETDLCGYCNDISDSALMIIRHND